MSYRFLFLFALVAIILILVSSFSIFGALDEEFNFEKAEDIELAKKMFNILKKTFGILSLIFILLFVLFVFKFFKGV